MNINGYSDYNSHLGVYPLAMRMISSKYPANLSLRKGVG